jgi:precorrin-4/cobalt-precorrin-4 C11-methyltransferase
MNTTDTLDPKESNQLNSEKKYPIRFVGAGPGDPDLITVKGQHALMEADQVIYAGSLVPEAVLKWTRPKTHTLNSASMHLDEIVNAMEISHHAGQKVVRLHTGDPSLYGAIFEQMAELDKRSIPYTVIPGVTAAFAAAAAMGIEFTLPEVTQTLIFTRMAGRTPVPETENLELLAAHQASMAIYLSIKLVEDVAKVLKKSYGANATCAIAYRVSQPEEKIVFARLDELEAVVKRERITHQALIIVGKVLDVSLSGLTHKSKLYDKKFVHGYRK